MSLKNKLSNFGTNILIYVFVIALFITVIGLGYRGKYLIPKESNCNVAFIGFIILLPFLIYFYHLYQKFQKKNRSELKEIKLLVKNGIRSEINLSELEITQNNDSLLIGNEIIINKYGNKNIQTRLNFKNNIVYHFYTDISIENLKIYFALNPKAYLYIDKNDKRKMYLDLEFLKK